MQQRPGRRRRCAIDGDTAVGARLPDRRARARSTTTTRSTARWRARAARARLPLARSAAPIFLGGRLWGAVIVSSVEPEPFAARRRAADRRLRRARRAGARQRGVAREELAASRARIVAAGDAERRRLERNLHDGAQQRLVSLALMLRMAARRHPSDPDLERAGEELDARAGGAARARARHPSRRADRARARAGASSAGRRARRCRSSSSSSSASGCPARSRPPPTTSSPRR